MTAPASPQARRNRSAGGRKAAEFVKRARRDGRYGPDGSARGSDQVRFSIADTLARIRAATDPGS